ncbi:signal peptidase I [Candidatus Peregrinibacteria bacterium]|nr:signal peptidase I [Candidatus Peregrinibacteria bacterium]
MTPKQHGLLFHLLDVLFNIIVIVAIVAGIRTFLVSPFQVEGNSMVDTLEDKQYIIINKLAYILGNPERGDVVVFRPPNDHEKYYVKRVIGLPGDQVMIKSGNVYLQEDGSDEFRELSEDTYLNDRNEGKTYRHPPGSGNTSEVTYTVPEESYFLLGDNRQGSLDSRSFTAENNDPIPYVSEDDIKGRVWFVALPITKIHALEPPEYGF